jgi:hypothetical protein
MELLVDDASVECINLLITLPTDDSRLIGRWFCGNFGSFPGFGMKITLAVFQRCGKCCSLKMPFAIPVRATRAFSGRRFSARLPMLSGPGAFRIISEISSGVVGGLGCQSTSSSTSPTWSRSAFVRLTLHCSSKLSANASTFSSSV